MINFAPFVLSFKLAFLTTLILFIIGVPLSWLLHNMKSKLKVLLEIFITLPIVLPPTVMGFYLLIFLSDNSPIGAFFEHFFGIKLVFNFTSLVIASCFYSLPFMIQPLYAAMQNTPKSLIEASYLCGKSPFRTLIYIVLPNIKPAIITSTIITFAHTIGEFGVILILGGSIPGQTKVASIAIYEFVEILDYKNAHLYSLIMLVIAIVSLCIVYAFNQKKK